MGLKPFQHQNAKTQKSKSLKKKKMKKETKNNSTSISEELLQRKPIEHTPFEAVKFENEPWFLGLGSYRLPITGETYEELVNNLETEKWNITLYIGFHLFYISY